MPERLYDEPDELAGWARRAADCARRADAAKAAPRSKATSRRKK
jgi:hypothetical protein